MDTAPRLPRGRLCVGDSGIPIQPPPLRGTSVHRKEGMSTRAPSFGRGCRAQRGGVGFLFLRRSRLLFAFPIGEGGPRQRRSGALVNGVLETIFPDLFSYRFPHPTSAPSGHLLPMEGGNVHASPFPWKGLPSAARRGWLPFLRRSRLLFAFPHWESCVILVPSSTTSIALTKASQRGAGSILRLFDRHVFSGGNPLHLFSNVLPHRRREQDRPARGIPLCGYSL